MRFNSKRSLVVWLLAASLAGGCAVPLPDHRPEVEPEPVPKTVPDREPMNSPAVLELSSNARQALSDRRFDEATQLLERAIRIEPRNGALWHELARVRFEQGDYEQAQQLATRSNALIDGGSALKARNDELIEAAREAQSY